MPQSEDTMANILDSILESRTTTYSDGIDEVVA